MGSNVELKTIDETAEELGCSRRTVERLLRKGHLERVSLPKVRNVYTTSQSIRNYQQALEESRDLTLVDVLLRVQKLETELNRLRYQNHFDVSDGFSLSPALPEDQQRELQEELERRHPEVFNAPSCSHS